DRPRPVHRQPCITADHRLTRSRPPVGGGAGPAHGHRSYLCAGESPAGSRPGASGRGPMSTRQPGTAPVIVCDGLVKIYKVADLEVVALQGLYLTVEPGEFVAIVGGLATPAAGTL